MCGGGSAAHHQGGFVSLGVASAAPRFDGPKGVEASALGRETRNTQDNNYYHLRAFEFNSTCIHATRATLHSAQGSSRCRRVEGPLAEERVPPGPGFPLALVRARHSRWPAKSDPRTHATHRCVLAARERPRPLVHTHLPDAQTPHSIRPATKTHIPGAKCGRRHRRRAQYFGLPGCRGGARLPTT